MHPAEHPLHSAKTEIKLQWIAIACMAIGLITSIYYHAHTLQAEHIESEINSYLHLNDRYHKLLFALLQNDSEVFKKTDPDSMRKNKYLMYELFELFATVDLLKSHFNELAQEVQPCWQRRMDFVFSKPAVQHAWKSHLSYAGKIYKPEFVQHVEKVISQISLLDASPARPDSKVRKFTFPQSNVLNASLHLQKHQRPGYSPGLF